MQSTGKIVMAFGEPCLNLIQTQGKKKQCPYYLNAIDEANADWQSAEYEEATPR